MLFTPYAIGSIPLKNRLVALPVFTGYAVLKIEHGLE